MRRNPFSTSRRRWLAAGAALAGGGLSLASAAGPASAGQSLAGATAPNADAAAVPEVVRLRVDSIIHPVAAQYVVEALADCDRQNVAAVVIELSTPGGLLTSTRDIFTAMLGAKTPVVVYVAPAGAQAASAGFFLLMASDVAAMAPGTNTGAAHPVGGNGETIEGTMGEKVEQDSAATIRSLAGRRGRNVALAEAAVVKSRSFTAEEALKEKLIEIVAPDLPALLAALEGREVPRSNGDKRVLHTAGATLRELPMTPLQRFLSTIAHPNIAYILMTLGFLGLYFELANPGVVLPGVVGGICLLLAFFALSVLPVNYAGLGLIVLGLLLFIAEIKVTSYGLLTVGGVISLVMGSLLLFRSAEPALRVSLSLVFSISFFALAVAGFLGFMALRARRNPVRTGVEGMLREQGVAHTALTPSGKVQLGGDYWFAIADESLPAGTTVEVVAVNGLTLRVRAVRPEGG